MSSKNIKEFRYGNFNVKYDMDALEKAVDNLDFDEEGNAYATGMMRDGCEVHVAIHASDDWEADDESDVLTIPASEIYGHVGPDGYDEFIITSIGDFEADVTEI